MPPSSPPCAIAVPPGARGTSYGFTWAPAPRTSYSGSEPVSASPSPGRADPRPLQNRVTPTGEIVAVPARGTLMGNRGRLHDDRRWLVRTLVPSYRAWVTCRLDFRGRRRVIMAPGRYTELFFLDEVTALAAGHRPCGECRRDDFRRFTEAWARGNARRRRDRLSGPGRLDPAHPIARVDRLLHADRIYPDGRPRRFRSPLAHLPDGTFVLPPDDPTPHLLWRGALWPWTISGYGPARPPLAQGNSVTVTVLTPRSTVATLAAGYEPAVHSTLRGAAEWPSRGGREGPEPPSATG